MTKTSTAAQTIRKHPDGGTYRILQVANTQGGWGISLTEWTTYRGQVRFEVERVSPENRTLRLGHFGSEKEARVFANQQWKLDRKP